MPNTPNHPALVMRALELAAMWHDGQFRKYPTERIPYVAHPAAVGFLLQRAGYEDDVVAAGILHDIIEDCDVTKEEIAAKTNARVADLVEWMSELPKSVPWKERKALYREKLRTAPLEVLAIKAADTISNLNSMLLAAEAKSDVWAIFAGTREEKLAHEQEVFDIIAARLESPLVEMHRRLLDVVKTLPPYVA